MTMSRRVAALGASCAIFMVTGCATLDKSSVAASNEIPGHNQVQEITIPYNPQFPKYLIAVEPLRWDQTAHVIEASSEGSRRCINGKCSATEEHKTVGYGVTAQLQTALTNAGNLAVVDMKMLSKRGDGTYAAKLQKGEKGPYILRGSVTEFSEEVDATQEKSGVSLGLLGAVAGIAGAVTGKDGLMWAGAGVAAANPSFEAEERSRTGMIAFDLQLVNAKTGRILRAFKVAGTFTAKSARNGVGLFGVSHSKTEFAQSVLGQAMRVAMNDAVQKTFDALKGS